MKEPCWLTLEELNALHAELVHRFGGPAGVRDPGLLEAALHRPIHHFLYDDPKPDLFTLAASYAEGIVGKHPFIDGNKRTGFMAAYVFLGANGLELIAPEEEAAERTLALAARAISEQDFALWLSKNCQPWT